MLRGVYTTSHDQKDLFPGGQREAEELQTQSMSCTQNTIDSSPTLLT